VENEDRRDIRSAKYAGTYRGCPLRGHGIGEYNREGGGESED
jgi:hypothetical protein